MFFGAVCRDCGKQVYLGEEATAMIVEEFVFVCLLFLAFLLLATFSDEFLLLCLFLFNRWI